MMHSDRYSAWCAGDVTDVRFGSFTCKTFFFFWIDKASQTFNLAIPGGQLVNVPLALEGSPLLEFRAADGKYDDL